MAYKSIDGLMRHLRNSGIAISGSGQKRNLMNTGYFHGYKGYRFFVFLRTLGIGCHLLHTRKSMQQSNLILD